MKNLKTQIISLTILIILFNLFALVLLPATECYAENITDVMKGQLGGVTLPSGDNNPEGKALTITGNLIKAFLSLFGVIFLILMIYGGYKWMLAAGREDEVKNAKDIIRGAMIGLVIVLMAYTITYFVAKSIQGAI